jgi:hypothetical protein
LRKRVKRWACAQTQVKRVERGVENMFGVLEIG